MRLSPSLHALPSCPAQTSLPPARQLSWQLPSRRRAHAVSQGCQKCWAWRGTASQCTHLPALVALHVQQVLQEPPLRHQLLADELAVLARGSREGGGAEVELFKLWWQDYGSRAAV